MSASHSRPVSRRVFLQAVGIAPLACGVAPAAAAPGDWPCFRGPNRNGIIGDRLTLRPGGPVKVWEAEVGHGNGSLAISQGRVYASSTLAESTVCLNAETGRPVWKQTMECHFGDTTPSVENGRVYGMASLGSGDATAFCCGAVKGESLWKRELPRSSGDRQYGHAGSPLLWEDLVILNAGAGVALKKASGEVVWQHPGCPGLATPVVFSWQGRPAVALFGGDRLIAREARTGRELWQIPWKTNLAVNACDPVIFDNKLFVCSEYGRGRSLYDLAGPRPRLLWEFGEGRGSAFSSGFVHEGNLYAFAEGSFGCLNVGTGALEWRVEGGSAAILVGGTVILVRHAGEVRFGRISPTAYQPLGDAQVALREIKAVPAYSAGKLYLRNERGTIVCLQIGA